MPGLRNAGISRCFRRQGKSWGWPRPTAGEGRRAAVQGDAEALDLERMLELQADTIEALVRAAGPATPYMPWASGTGGPPCCDSVAGVKPGRAPGAGGPWAGGVLFPLGHGLVAPGREECWFWFLLSQERRQEN